MYCNLCVVYFIPKLLCHVYVVKLTIEQQWCPEGYKFINKTVANKTVQRTTAHTEIFDRLEVEDCATICNKDTICKYIQYSIKSRTCELFNKANLPNENGTDKVLCENTGILKYVNIVFLLLELLFSRSFW